MKAENVVPRRQLFSARQDLLTYPVLCVALNGSLSLAQVNMHISQDKSVFDIFCGTAMQLTCTYLPDKGSNLKISLSLGLWTALCLITLQNFEQDHTCKIALQTAQA